LQNVVSLYWCMLYKLSGGVEQVQIIVTWTKWVCEERKKEIEPLVQWGSSNENDSYVSQATTTFSSYSCHNVCGKPPKNLNLIYQPKSVIIDAMYGFRV
jgi:hypothetical protein